MTRKGEIKQHQDTPVSFSQRISFAMARHKTLEDIFVVPKRSNIFTLLPYCCQGFFPTNVSTVCRGPRTIQIVASCTESRTACSPWALGFGFFYIPQQPAARSSSGVASSEKSHSSSGFGGRAQLTLAVFHVSRTVERLQRSLRCLSFVSGSIRALVLQVMPSMFQEPVLCAEAWPAVVVSRPTKPVQLPPVSSSEAEAKLK